MKRLSPSKKKRLQKYYFSRGKRYRNFALKVLLFSLTMCSFWAIVDFDYYYTNASVGEVITWVGFSLLVGVFVFGYDLWKNEKDIKKYESQLTE